MLDAHQKKVAKWNTIQMPQSSSGSKGAKFGFGSSTSRFDVRGVSAVQICQPLPILPSQYVAVHHQKIVSILFLNNINVFTSAPSSFCERVSWRPFNVRANPAFSRLHQTRSNMLQHIFVLFFFALSSTHTHTVIDYFGTLSHCLCAHRCAIDCTGVHARYNCDRTTEACASC